MRSICLSNKLITVVDSLHLRLYFKLNCDKYLPSMRCAHHLNSILFQMIKVQRLYRLGNLPKRELNCDSVHKFADDGGGSQKFVHTGIGHKFVFHVIVCDTFHDAQCTIFCKKIVLFFTFVSFPLRRLKFVLLKSVKDMIELAPFYSMSWLMNSLLCECNCLTECVHFKQGTDRPNGSR